jgi:hypothetical protein
VKTPRNQLTVLATLLAGIAGTLWVASRVVRGPERTPIAANDVAPYTDVAVEPEPSLLALPLAAVQRGLVERPLDEARCGMRHDDVTFTALIQDASGGRIGGARLAVFAVNGGTPDLRDFVEARGLDDGRACVRTAREGEVFVAVFAPGFVPSARLVDAKRGTRIDLEPFVLEPGVVIRGSVKIGGQPIARAEVEAVSCPMCEVFEIGNQPYAWRDGRFVHARCSAETDARGDYVLAGLEAGAHSVRLRAIRSPEVAIDVSKSTPVRTTAPADKIDFALPGARLRLEFRSPQGPLCCVDAQIEAGDRQFTRSANEAGRLDVIIQPALAYPIVATRRGFTARRMQLRGLVDGESHTQTIELDPQLALATVRVQDDGSAGVDEATFAFRPTTPLMHGSAFERTVRRDARNGQFVIRDVPAGAWMMTLLSGRALSGPSTMDGRAPLTLRTNCDADAAVNVPDSGEMTVKLVVNRRGGVELVVRDPTGARLAAHAKVFDPRGQELDAVLLRPESQAIHSVASAARNEEALLLYPLSCYGNFQVAVHMEGFEPARVSLTTHSGLVVPLEVELTPR